MDAKSFLVAEGRLTDAMLSQGRPVHTERWQGMDIASRPDLATIELLNVRTEVTLRGIMSLDHWRAECRPHLPWADEHFEERVSGVPHNPPPSWVRWPWAHSADKFRADEKFNHTYPERLWPKFAGSEDEWQRVGRPIHGIRGAYGDLSDLVELLRHEPLTRQAYIPLFFPEDTGVGDGGRKPCTLGYQFIVRDGKLHCYYPLRSCDFIRHYRDDVYFAVRLLLWVLHGCQPHFGDTHPMWTEVVPGTLTMHMTSLHCFVNDFAKLQRDHASRV